MGESENLKPGDKASPSSLIKLWNQDYVNFEYYFGKNLLYVSFLVGVSLITNILLSLSISQKNMTKPMKFYLLL